MVSEKEVEKKLKNVIDPELKVNIVDLGLIYEIDVENGGVYILMTLTSKSCPLADVFDDLVKEEVIEIEEYCRDDIDIELTFDPAWNPNKMSDNGQRELGNIPGHTKAF